MKWGCAAHPLLLLGESAAKALLCERLSPFVARGRRMSLASCARRAGEEEVIHKRK